MRRRSDNALVFMAKWPEPGRAKTRLCPPLTAEEAAACARAFLLDMLTEASFCDADRWLAFAPAASHPAFVRLVGSGVGLIEADGADLGAALRRAQFAAFARGYRRVALVASDIPHLPAARYADAFAALEEADVAIGPSGDGGYYLLASKRETPLLFDNVPWSTASVLDQTLLQAQRAGLDIRLIPSCDDVDVVGDLTWLEEQLRRRPGAGHTLSVLEGLHGRVEGVAAD